eukprot:761944-Hanusia_phi.AAC.1
MEVLEPYPILFVPDDSNCYLYPFLLLPTQIDLTTDHPLPTGKLSLVGSEWRTSLSGGVQRSEEEEEEEEEETEVELHLEHRGKKKVNSNNTEETAEQRLK